MGLERVEPASGSLLGAEGGDHAATTSGMKRHLRSTSTTAPTSVHTTAATSVGLGVSTVPDMPLGQGEPLLESEEDDQDYDYEYEEDEDDLSVTDLKLILDEQQEELSHVRREMADITTAVKGLGVVVAKGFKRLSAKPRPEAPPEIPSCQS